MDFPARKAERRGAVSGLAEALGAEPTEVYGARDILAVFETEGQVRTMSPDFAAIEKIKDAFAIIVTAPGAIFLPECLQNPWPPGFWRGPSLQPCSGVRPQTGGGYLR